MPAPLPMTPGSAVGPGRGPFRLGARPGLGHGDGGRSPKIASRRPERRPDQFICRQIYGILPSPGAEGLGRRASHCAARAAPFTVSIPNSDRSVIIEFATRTPARRERGLIHCQRDNAGRDVYQVGKPVGDVVGRAPTAQAARPPQRTLSRSTAFARPMNCLSIRISSGQSPSG